MGKTKIQWTDYSWPVINGCVRKSAGCENCYAERLTATRLSTTPKYGGLAVMKSNGPHWTGAVRLHEKSLLDPLRIKKPARFFVCDMGDLFYDVVPDKWIEQVFAVMLRARRHTFQILTKRPARMLQFMKQHSTGGRLLHLAGEIEHKGADEESGEWPRKNIWLGVSCEDQQTADERIPLLLETPAALRWISAEPLLGPIDFTAYLPYNPVHDGQQEYLLQRREGLPISSCGGTGDRSAGTGMAGSETRVGSLATEDGDAAMQASARRTRHGGLSHGQSDVRQETLHLPSQPIGLPPRPRANSERHDDQPQGRKQEAERAIEFRTTDSFREYASRTKRSQSRETGSVGRKECDGQDSDRSTERDQTAAERGGTTDSDSKRLRDQFSASLADREGRPSISWLVCGGESGPGARSLDLAWLKSIVTQCQRAKVPVFVKQLGYRPWWDGLSTKAPADHVYLEAGVIKDDKVGWQFDCMKDRKGGDISEWPADLRVRQFPKAAMEIR